MSNKFQITVKVYYEDTDAAGVVYYANYLKFMERCRTDWLNSYGISQNILNEENHIFVVKKVEIEYKAPARLEDNLTVTISAVEVNNSSLVIHQSVYRDTTELISAKVTVVCINHSFKVTRIPEDIKSKI